MTKEQYTFIDLFAGCGGLSEGFVQAGFLPIAHVEMNREACESLRTRSCYHYCHSHGKEQIYLDYLRGIISRNELFCQVPSRLLDSVINEEISDSTIEDIFQRIHNLADGQEVDLIIGGPPCQAYSLLGRHHKEMEDDPRTKLYIQYGKFLKEFNPKGFVFENVPGLLSAKKGEHFKNLQDYFNSMGYNVRYRMLTASDYGVLQERHRLIIVGWRDDFDLGYPDFKTHRTDAVVNDILSDLPRLHAGEIKHIAEYECPTNQYLRNSGIRLDCDSFVTQNITRRVNENDAKIYKFAIQLWNEKRVRLKYTDLPVELRSHKNEGSFLDRYKVVDGEGKSHTVVAHLSKDGHYYIHPNIKYCRSISVREAARLQSFPDNFYFEGSRSAIYKQIGNAVPPLMARSIAETIKEMLWNK